MKFLLSFLFALGLLIDFSCGKSNGFSPKPQLETTSPDAPQTASASPNPPAFQPAASQPILPVRVGQRAIEQVLCQDGYKLLGLIEKTSFHEIFGLACTPQMSTPIFQELVTKAYAGNGDPHVKLIHFKVGEMFVTRMTVAYAMKIAIDNPSLFYSLKAHDSLAEGIQEKNSEVLGLVESRRNFPGRRSIEEIILNYSLQKSEGGGLYDKRRTEFNTYLVNESLTDVVIATEELLDAPSNRTYHDYKGLLLGIKGEPGFTYLVFINDFTIKNRIDPLRLQRTLLVLSQGMQKKMLTFLQKQKGIQP